MIFQTCCKISLNSINLTCDGRGDRDEEDESAGGIQARKSQDAGGDPTYEMACVRRYITGTESIGQFIENSRKMFLLQVNILCIGACVINYLKNEIKFYITNQFDNDGLYSILFSSTRCQ